MQGHGGKLRAREIETETKGKCNEIMDIMGRLNGHEGDMEGK